MEKNTTWYVVDYLLVMAKKKLIFINAHHNRDSSYLIKKTGDVVLCNTRPPPEGGTGTALVVTLPRAQENAGRVITIKDAGAYAAINKITIQRQAADLIEGGNTTIIIHEPSAFRTLISDGIDTWHEIGIKI